MMGRLLTNCAALARLVFALLAAASGARFGLVGFNIALQAATPAPDPQGPLPPRQAPPVHSASSAPSAGPSSSIESGGEPLVLTLAVTAGAARSEVYVNGRRVGHSPFFGDLSCKQGNPLKIAIVPEKGELLEFERACRPGMMRIDESALNDPYQ